MEGGNGCRLRADVIRAGLRLGHHKILDVIGAAARPVYRALDTALGRNVRLKVLSFQTSYGVVDMPAAEIAQCTEPPHSFACLEHRTPDPRPHLTPAADDSFGHSK